jgi:hypothetical protein
MLLLLPADKPLANKYSPGPAQHPPYSTLSLERSQFGAVIEPFCNALSNLKTPTDKDDLRLLAILKTSSVIVILRDDDAGLRRLG